MASYVVHYKNGTNFTVQPNNYVVAARISGNFNSEGYINLEGIDLFDYDINGYRSRYGILCVQCTNIYDVVSIAFNWHLIERQIGIPFEQTFISNMFDG